MRHIMIPDVQDKPGCKTNHLLAAGQYIADHIEHGDRIICIGDFFDMPSLSSYEERGSSYWHEQDFHDDIEHGKDSMDILMKPILKKKKDVSLDFCLGNHEQRMQRAANAADSKVFRKMLQYEALGLEQWGWKVHDFLKVIKRDKILYSHYFQNQASLMKRPLSSHVETMLKVIGYSFMAGHQQSLRMGMTHNSMGERRCGVVCGSFYQHPHDYLGKQGQYAWQGIVVANEVKNGAYDPMPVSLDYLLSRYQ